MKFLIDENISPKITNFLKRISISAENVFSLNLQSKEDTDIIELLREENRILITFDKEFGNILNYPVGSNPGIIILRIKPKTVDNTEFALSRIFNKFKPSELYKKLVIVDNNKIRIREK